MRWPWRFQFGIRTLLLATLVLPPLIAVQYRKWQENQIWSAHDAAKQRRDDALVAWRVAYDSYSNNPSAAAWIANETKAQQRYYAARQEVEVTVKAIQARYGTERELSRAMQARRKR